MDATFRALADPTRRALLDGLFERDGQTLLSLTAKRNMTRIAVAKHLAILEEAGLVIAKRSGREKHHFLNVIPIRQLHDRWITKYTEGWAAALTDLKTTLEATMEKIFEIYIRTTPEQLWHAITDAETRTKFQFGASIESDWTDGSTYTTTHPRADRALSHGKNVVVDPPNRLVQSLVTTWSADVEPQATTRVTWEIEPIGDSCRLTVTHDQLRDDAPPALYGGWPMILSGLKTWLETGKVLTTPGSQMYSDN